MKESKLSLNSSIPLLGQRLMCYLPQFRILLLVLLGVLVLTYITSVVQSAGISGWNDMRLAPSLYLLNDIPLYGIQSNPGLSTIYGPTPALFYAPSLVADNPNSAIRLGQIISFVLGISALIVPVWWVSGWAGFQNKSSKMLLALLVLAIAFTTSTISSGLFIIHADAPALFLITMAAVALSFPQKSRFVLASVCCALAVGCKITYAMAPVGLFLYVLVQSGLKTSLRYAVIQTLVILLAVSLLLMKFDALALWDAMVDLPSRHPWKFYLTLDYTHQIHTSLLWKLACAFQFTSLFLFKLLVFFTILPFLFHLSSQAIQKSPVGEPLARWRNCCFFLAIALFPAGLPGYLKEGGAENSMTGLSLFIFQFLLVIALPLFKQFPRQGLLVGAVAILTSIVSVRLLTSTAINLMQFRTSEKIYSEIETSLRDHAGKLWFGARPLAHWYYERKAILTADLIWSHRLAGRNLPVSWIKAYLPPDTRAIVGFKYDSWIALGPQSVRPGLKPVAIEGLPESVISYDWPSFEGEELPPL